MKRSQFDSALLATSPRYVFPSFLFPHVSRPNERLTSVESQSKVTNFPYKNWDRLSIIDPNNPSNDISGGSSNFATIAREFSDAYIALRDRMNDVASMPASDRQNASILGVILGGNYKNFETQRIYMRQLYEKVYGPCTDEPCNFN